MNHLIFMIADHFEPRAAEQMDAWRNAYPEAVKSFRDSSGRSPRHTWFYDAEESSVLGKLSELCRLKLGEIEVHLHHSFDTPEGLREKLERRKDAYSKFGALTTGGGGKTFGFVHGKWSLDNSRGSEHCGVNNELQVLREAGCYADFTFPAWGRLQPKKKNSIYYAADDPAKPKSYDDGVDVEVGGKPSGDLMIFQGPGGLSGVPRSVGRRPLLARLADRLWLTCGLDPHLPPWPGRIDRWVNAQVHVKGRPECIFIKAHMHGARPETYGWYFSDAIPQLHGYLTTRYNDGKNWRLHYVTAREAYNIVKAAEAGMTGAPESYRDFVIPPYLNTR